MSDINELFKALAKAHEEISNPVRSKEVIIRAKTGGSYGFKYAPLDEIINQTRPILVKQGLFITQTLLIENGSHVLLTNICHSSGGILSSSLPFGPVPTDPKEYGSRLTYLKRYGMCNALNIAAEDDTDAPPKFTGKLNKTKLKSEIAKFGHDIAEQVSSKDLQSLWQDHRDAIEQAKNDYPQLLTGIEGGVGVEDLYRSTMTALISMEREAKQLDDKFKDKLT